MSSPTEIGILFAGGLFVGMLVTALATLGVASLVLYFMVDA